AGDGGQALLDEGGAAVDEAGQLGAVLAGAGGDRFDLRLVVLAQVGGVGARDRPLLPHPGNGDRSVQTAREGDPDTLTNRQGRQNLRHGRSAYGPLLVSAQVSSAR